MKKLIVLISLISIGVLSATGVAFAANIQCEVDARRCNGTPESDRIIGSEGDDDINARQGGDVVNGLEGDDVIQGGTGADRLSGGVGEETMSAYATNNAEAFEDLRFIDNSDDIIRGGGGGESIIGGGGQGGVDQIFGDGGNDVIGVDQRFYRAQGVETRVTREIVDCGPGIDQIFYDNRVDEVNRETCEVLNPTGPDGEPTGGSRETLSAISARPELIF